ncbi:DUF5133 domain-containing protein [Streptomyces kunmingensis]|uniref:DUF5133 domain-containing protein n=1 Tax=Streptomyces kunmingensis TaxID=68225 RepID=A0ABU6CA41_9ACTN|nr:DUF5133 domain-containing protein [Streptomyces kunmingensis]MEB3961586.1 DUF5133 domain-containing protein [Streptomyces kunmingensis]
MITPHPQILRALLSRYAKARVQLVEDDTAANRRLLEDVAYTLCVTTGTREIKDALATAERLLAAEPSPTGIRPAPGQEQADQTLVA